MIAYNANQTTTEAVIHLKNGNRKYGVLISGDPESDSYQFVSNNHRCGFNETLDDRLVEIVPGILIEAIEIDLK